MSDESILIVSADGHVGAPLDEYLPYFTAERRDEFAALLAEEERAFRQGATGRPTAERTDPDRHEALWEPMVPERYGAWDVDVRLEQLDRDGIAGEILIPGHQFTCLPLFSVMNRPFEADIRDAGYRAYHRWLADFMAEADGRLYGMADPGPCLDMASAVRELRWAADHGFVCVGAPGIIADPYLPPIHHEHYEPFWAACAELDVPLLIHAGWGFPQGKFQEFLSKFLSTHHGAEVAAELIATRAELDDEAREALRREFAESPTSPLRLDFGPRRLLWQLMLAGVFDRYPNLRFVLTEVRSDWVPTTLRALDEWYAANDTPLRRSPSEYWHQHCYATPSSIHRAEVEGRHEIGVDRVMFGADYPHPEATWPDTWNWIRAAFEGVAEHDARRILGENAVECFRLDRTGLEAVAARIGPRPSDVLTERHAVDPSHIEHFHARAGFSRPTEDVDIAAVRQLVQEDVQLVRG